MLTNAMYTEIVCILKQSRGEFPLMKFNETLSSGFAVCTLEILENFFKLLSGVINSLTSAQFNIT